jgi:predicted peptidase
MGVWSMTGLEPDLFAAGIVIAADPVIGSLKGTAIVPKYVIHSRIDEVFPFADVERDVQAEINMGAPIVFTPVDNFSHTSILSYTPALKGSELWLKGILEGTIKSN